NASPYPPPAALEVRRPPPHGGRSNTKPLTAPVSQLGGVVNIIARFFRLAEHGTTIRTEVLGGITTFAAMAYIIVVNPAILSGMLPVGPSTVATILVAVVGCLLMGLYANRPIAVAPYMGENAFLAFGLIALGVTWQQRLGAVFVAGVVFAVI